MEPVEDCGRIVVFCAKCWNLEQSMGARNRVGTELSHRPARLCSLAGNYDKPISTPFLVPIDCYKIPELVNSWSKYPTREKPFTLSLNICPKACCGTGWGHHHPYFTADPAIFNLTTTCPFFSSWGASFMVFTGGCGPSGWRDVPVPRSPPT